MEWSQKEYCNLKVKNGLKENQFLFFYTEIYHLQPYLRCHFSGVIYHGVKETKQAVIFFNCFSEVINSKWSIELEMHDIGNHLGETSGKSHTTELWHKMISYTFPFFWLVYVGGGVSLSLQHEYGNMLLTLSPEVPELKPLFVGPFGNILQCERVSMAIHLCNLISTLCSCNSETNRTHVKLTHLNLTSPKLFRPHIGQVFCNPTFWVFLISFYCLAWHQDLANFIGH